MRWQAIALPTWWLASVTLATDASIVTGIESWISAHPISTRTVTPPSSSETASIRQNVLDSNWTRPDTTATPSRCPVDCSGTDLEYSNWPVYHSFDRLNWCNKTMLLGFNIFNSLDDPDTHISIAACVADLSDDSLTSSTPITSSSGKSCLPASDSKSTTKTTDSLPLSWTGDIVTTNVDDTIEALRELQAFSIQRTDSCNETIIFALSGETAVGIYVGSSLTRQGIISSLLSQLSSRVQSDGVGETMFTQLCDSTRRSARYSLGIMINTEGDLSSVQHAVQSWKNNSCVSTETENTVSDWQSVTFDVPSVPSKATNSTSLNSRRHYGKSHLHARSTCTVVEVASGDTCTSLASECGVTETVFEGYNGDACSSPLAVGQHLCCSSGTLPDYTPTADSDDNCYSYTVQLGDTCSYLAAYYDITVTEIESWNNDTWAWMGCDDLQPGNYICLSSGWPPMPATVSNAVCGPQVNNTPIAPHGTNFSTLNECPLNACCDIWGQCGTTTEFCTISQSTTGAPGTAAKSENGCISNCGTDILISGTPSTVYSIAYFEGFDWSRPCLTMSISEVDTSLYTHIHFAFALIGTDYTLNISSIEAQLPFFTELSGVKRILSVGGWDFSTDPSTYMIFRDAVTSANRATLIDSVVKILDEYDLDGVDWDWEYPDEPDIPGIPAGTVADSTNYFATLAELAAALEGTGKTISVTTPASYWYLKQFPIQAISLVVDYIVYMTYDLHGQWDYGNAYVDPGCDGGNCLRSHVNLTETINSLSMITKAGVSNTQVVVGVSSYGRSFEMTTEGCWTDMCTYTGPDSGATPGQCTQTAGYIADAEIDSIIADNPSAEVYWDDNSYSNIVVYNETQWASYMNDSNKIVREILYNEIYQFAGIADWAVDLQSEGDSDDSSSSSSDSGSSTVYIGPTIWSEATPIVTALPGETLVWPPLQLTTTTTITFDLWTTILSFSTLSSTTYTDWQGSTSTDHVYNILEIPTVLSIAPVEATSIPVWNVILPSEASGSYADIILTSSVQPPIFTVIVTPVWDGTTVLVSPTTTTQNSTIVAWSSTTYVISAQTETVGSSTIISGGTTGSPTPVVITPPPHPTQVESTKDPKVNSVSTTWKSGSPSSPTCAAGEICGIPCLFWCNSDCPFCPPDLFGSSGGGGGSDGSDPDSKSGTSKTDSTSKTSSSSSSSSSSETTTYTAAGFHLDIADDFPTTSDPWSSFTAMSAELSSAEASNQGSTSTSKSTTSTTSASSTKKTTSSTSTSSTAAATPTDGTKLTTIFLMTEYTDELLEFWVLVDTVLGDDANPCNINTDYMAEADTVAPDPDFPDTDFDDFTAHGVDGCEYKYGKDNTVGTMTCPGVDNISCQKSEDYNTDYDCDTGPDMVQVIDCFWL
ncbi:hypothetical protein N7456_007841 [Penicillium angulare]|uniref:chitinase n=1 Tax=Penicillium angulare TaxID=116970 RepID=A0A9W9FBM6_9EURO|nr:hypothetical protein N7456_007841 [Penicillium angulare]